MGACAIAAASNASSSPSAFCFLGCSILELRLEEARREGGCFFRQPTYRPIFCLLFTRCPEVLKCVWKCLRITLASGDDLGTPAVSAKFHEMFDRLCHGIMTITDLAKCQRNVTKYQYMFFLFRFLSQKRKKILS